MRADMNAYYKKMDARYEKRMAIMDAYYEGMIAIIKECLEKTKALLETTEAFPAKTEAFLERKGSAPEELESMAEPKEVPERATEQETGEAAEDRTGKLRLAVRRHRQRKKQSQENGGPREKFAAFRGRVTHCAVPVLNKGHVRKEPRRNRRSGVKGLGKTSGSRIENPGLKERWTKDKAVRGTLGKGTCKRNRRTCPVFGNGLRDRGERQSTLVRNGMRFCEAIRQRLDVKIAKFIFESYIRLREPGDCLLWKCRPPLKRKR
jgi:hypothetical protein